MSNTELVLLLDTLKCKLDLSDDDENDMNLLDLINEACDYLLLGE